MTFDCWGPAVRLAVKLQHHSLPGCILVNQKIKDETIHEFDYLDAGSKYVIYTLYL